MSHRLKSLFWGLCMCTASLMASEDEICFYPGQESFLPSNCYSYPPPPISIQPCYSYFYVGLEGGWIHRLRHIPKHSGVGVNNIGTSFDAKAQQGYHVGASIGYRLNTLLRMDISYTYLHPKTFNWTADFLGEQPDTFKAKFNTHLVLFNTYVHLNGLCCPFPTWDPYITCGVGAALSRLDNIQELFSGIYYAKIQPYTQTQFAGRVGVGVMKYFCRCWILDLGFNANYIRSIRSGNERETFNIPGVSVASHEKIGVYRFNNLWIGNFYLGLKYAF